MTLDEARGCLEPALWIGNREEFLLNPDSGVIWWRCLDRETGEVHGDYWRSVPGDVCVPDDGWSHRLDCSCPHCR